MDFDLELKLSIYHHFAEQGSAPKAEDLSLRLKRSPEEIVEGFQRLAAKRMLVLMPDGRSIQMAPPFSGVETQHRVRVGKVDYFANCAWDAFGIVAALGGAGEVRSRCEQTGEPLRLQLTRAGPEPSSWVFHTPVPASRWWRDIVFT
nr:putative transmembrane protein [uncultured bacterium]